MTEDLSLVQINTQGLDSDLNNNFTALENAVNTVSLDLSAFETATQSALSTETARATLAENTLTLNLNSFETATQSSLSLKANDSSVVHLAATETISGDKTFSGTTTIGSSTGLLKTTSGVVSNAIAGTDYLKTGDQVRTALNYSTRIINGAGTQTYETNIVTKAPITTIYSDTLNEINTTTGKITFARTTDCLFVIKAEGSVLCTKIIYIYIGGTCCTSQSFYGKGGQFVICPGVVHANQNCEIYLSSESTDTIVVQTIIKSLLY